MRVRLSAILLLLLWSVAAGLIPAQAAPSSVQLLLDEANQYYVTAKDNMALQKFEEVLAVDPNCYEALYKASLLNSHIGNRYSDVISKINYFEKARYYADLALCAFPEAAEGSYAMALAIHNKALALNVKERMASSKVIKFYLDEAVCAKPDYADAWQLLGRWHFKNANLNLAEKSAVNLFFGGVSLDASNEQAVAALETAIKLNPNNISYYFDLACVYREMKKDDMSMAMLQDAINLKLLTSDELEISRRCKAMLEELDRT